MKKIVQTCNRSGPCNYLSNLLVNAVRVVILCFIDYRIPRPGCLRSYADIFIQLARYKFYTVQRSLNSINKLPFDNFRVLNIYPKLLIFPLLLNFSIHSDLILYRCVRHIFSFLSRCSVDFFEPIIVWWVPGNNLKFFLCLLNCLKYDLSCFAIVCWTEVRGSRFCACILTF